MIALRRILVATDYSPAARSAVWRAGEMAARSGASLHLIHARPDWNLFCRRSPGRSEDFRAISEHAEKSLRTELDYLRSTFGVRATGDVRMGSASEVLRAVVTQTDPNLVVIAGRGEHQTKALVPLLGGTALKMLAATDRPLLVVRKAGGHAYRSTLAAVDGSRETARRVVDWAISMLEAGDCHVVHAFDAPFVERLKAHGASDAIIESCVARAREVARAAIDEQLGHEPGEGKRLQTRVVCGEPISTVLAEIERYEPELVVLGKHQRLPLEAPTHFVGTIALRIAYHTPTDVLIVP